MRSCAVGLLLLGIQLLALNMIAQVAIPESLTIDQGLSQGMVFDILQTRDGFLWIGSKDGLNRYDGYKFRIWTNAPDDPYSISDNTITALFEDSRGWLWIGCESQGINLMDRKRERFFHINLPTAPKELKQILYDVQSIREDKHGNIWIVNRGAGVFRLTIPESWSSALPETPELGGLCTIERIRVNGSQEKKGLQEEFLSICPMQDGSTWMGSSKGLYSIDNQTLIATKFDKATYAPNEASKIEQTESGEIWGSFRNGIFYYKNGRFQYNNLGIAREIGTMPALKKDNSGGIWILFEKKIWQVSQNHPFDFEHPAYVIDKHANALSLDAQDNIWVGTLGYGLRKITPRKAMFNKSLDGTSIWGVWRDKQKGILCKLFNTIVAYDPQTQHLSAQSAFPDAMPQQNDLLYEPSGNFWLLCGLRDNRINKSQLRHYRADHTLIAAYDIVLDRYPHARLLRTTDGCIWASGTSGCLLRCNPATGEVSTFDFGYLFGVHASAIQTIALVEDGNGDIWAGTSLGLVKGVKKGAALDFQLFKATTRQGPQFKSNSIACLLPDPQEPGKKLWIGTKGGGISCLDLHTGAIANITMDQGLPNNVIYSILPDQSGHFWCSSNRGLFKLTLDGTRILHIKMFTEADGLQDNEFNTQAYFKAPNGELFFGGVDGLNYFIPEKLEFNDQAPQVYITGLEINHEPEWFGVSGDILPYPIEYLHKITLQATQNNLSFEFAALDFTDPAKNRYRYQMLPIEQKWVEAGSQHFAHYTHLSPGNYFFQVQGCNSDGACNEEPLEIEIVILAPWWQTRLAWFLYLSIIAGIIWRFYLTQRNSIRLREQVALEQRESERIRVMEQMKTNFFSDVTHEFRTPLTLTIAPLQQVLKNPNAPNWLSKVKLAARNSQKLLHLVNELLDLAKIESGAMKVYYQAGFISDILRPVVETFAGAAESKEIQLRMTVPENDFQGDFDVDKLEKICFNLISNAIKFTPVGGQVQVQVKHAERRDEATKTEKLVKGVQITVADNGRGISKIDLPFIFDRFYQVSEISENGKAGTGIGLALCRELAQLMGGEISVESEVGQGACFQVWLPLLQQISDQFQPENSDMRSAQSQILPDADLVSDKKVIDESNISPIGRPLLLLAEDNDELRAFLSQILSDTYEVIEAPDGQQAIEIARQRVPDIVVSDIFMPHLDGIGLLDILKKDVVTSHIPVLLLTSKTELESRLEGLQHGADAYLGKPFQTEELFAWLDNLLETRRRLQKKFTGQVPVLNNDLPDYPDNNSATIPIKDEEWTPLDRIFVENLRKIAEQEIDNDQLSMEDVAKWMAMSRSQLHRKLSAITGQSASEFLRNYRLNRAMELLRAKEGNVSEVAWRVGFRNAKYFSTAFKEHFGISPSEV